jgi:hypothetical protein
VLAHCDSGLSRSGPEGERAGKALDSLARFRATT